MDSPERAAGTKRNILLLCSSFGAPYRVLRTAAALSRSVHVMGSANAQLLRASRYCRSFETWPLDAAEDARALAARIDAVAAARNADLVLAGDMLTTRLLVRAKPFLATPTFPLPELSTLDALATKDRFAALCADLGVRHPRTVLYRDRDALRAAVQGGDVRFPAIVKPVNRSGSIGVMRVGTAEECRALPVDYAPVLVQDFIDGEDRSITVFCDNGAVRKQVVYSHPAGVFRFAREAAVEQVVADIARALSLTGIYNFDARIDADGEVWMIECNPRFFFNMDVAMIAGVNFVDTEADSASPPECEIRVPAALLRDLFALRSPRKADWRMLAHWLEDPLVFVLAGLGFEHAWWRQWLGKMFEAVGAIRRKMLRLKHFRNRAPQIAEKRKLAM